jgi:protein TonB
MTNDHALPFPAAAPRSGKPHPSPARRLPAVGSWRYECRRTSRTVLLISALLSATAHAGLVFGLRGQPKPVARPVEEAILVSLVMPDLKELEEPETVLDSHEGTTEDFTALVPMQADLPQIPQPTDFVQQLDFTSLIEPPDLSQAKLLSIPDHARRGGKIAELGQIFNLADLDRIPEAVLQTPPVFPTALKREVTSAGVTVEFVVDTQGRVVNTVVVSCTYPGFEIAAIQGVERWKFRPGMRGGRKVNTRMRVPIIFRVVD